MTTIAARSVGAGDEIGAIKVGYKADLTFIDLKTPALRPIVRLVSNIVHYGHPGCVHSVMVDGEFLMRDRKVLTIDEDALMEEADRVTRRVWERMVADNPDIARPDGELQWLGTDS